jgi:hypothetical protein
VLGRGLARLVALRSPSGEIARDIGAVDGVEVKVPVVIGLARQDRLIRFTADDNLEPPVLDASRSAGFAHRRSAVVRHD